MLVSYLSSLFLESFLSIWAVRSLSFWTHGSLSIECQPRNILVPFFFWCGQVRVVFQRELIKFLAILLIPMVLELGRTVLLVLLTPVNN